MVTIARRRPAARATVTTARRRPAARTVVTTATDAGQGT